MVVAERFLVIRSGRQLRPGLFGDHVGGVPVGPVLVVSSGALLVFAVGGCRTDQGGDQVVVRVERVCVAGCFACSDFGGGHGALLGGSAVLPLHLDGAAGPAVEEELVEDDGLGPAVLALVAVPVLLTAVLHAVVAVDGDVVGDDGGDG